MHHFLMMRSVPIVTVYVPCCNYGQYLQQALTSIERQSLSAWELIVFTEGSQDQTRVIAHSFAERWPDTTRIVETSEPLGLRGCANRALEMARGEFIIRLDADDFLDENAFLVLTEHLRRHPENGLAYPNWIYVNESGQVLAVEKRKRPGDEVEVIDLPAHGACTMIRKRVLKSVGGYDQVFTRQDGYEVWLKIMNRFGLGHVETPLFYYRQHNGSMSTDQAALLAARRAIKRKIANRYGGSTRPRCLALIVVEDTEEGTQNTALAELAGQPLIDFTLQCAQELPMIDRICVSTNDPAVVSHSSGWPRTIAQMRRRRAGTQAAVEILREALAHVETQHDFFADVLIILNMATPLRKPNHILEAIDTLLIHDVDAVVSTCEVWKSCFRHGPLGLEPLNPAMEQRLRLEREALYEGNGAIHVLWRDKLRTKSLWQGKIGHVLMERQESLQATDPIERISLEALLLGQTSSTEAAAIELP